MPRDGQGISGKPMALIDIGSTFLRLTIAEKRAQRGVAPLERMEQSVAIGRDVVRTGRIANETTEQCVAILARLMRLLNEYGIEASDVRAVAASALSLAENHEAFLNRLNMASRLRFRLLDSGQVAYYYHLAFRAFRKRQTEWDRARVVVMEIGGLATHLLYRQDGEIRFAQTYGVGSLRIRQQLDAAGFGLDQFPELVDGRTRDIVASLKRNINISRSVKLLFVGREMRFVTARLREPHGRRGDLPAIMRVSVAEFGRLMRDTLRDPDATSDDARSLAFQDGDVLAATLCMAYSVARALRLRDLHVGSFSFCDGVLIEERDSPAQLAVMMRHALRVARETGEKYLYDARHAQQVRDTALALFDLLREEHGCDERTRLLLELASLLHDIGAFVNTRGHHKHSMYLIRNTEFIGLSGAEIAIMALVARYHRKGLPQPTHAEYNALPPGDRLLVCKLAAILRVADALDRVHDQSLGRLRFELRPDVLICIPQQQVATSAEQSALIEKGDLFQQIYGRRCWVGHPDDAEGAP